MGLGNPVIWASIAVGVLLLIVFFAEQINRLGTRSESEGDDWWPSLNCHIA